MNYTIVLSEYQGVNFPDTFSKFFPDRATELNWYVRPWFVDFPLAYRCPGPLIHSVYQILREDLVQLNPSFALVTLVEQNSVEYLLSFYARDKKEFISIVDSGPLPNLPTALKIADLADVLVCNRTEVRDVLARLSIEHEKFLKYHGYTALTQ